MNPAEALRVQLKGITTRTFDETDVLGKPDAIRKVVEKLQQQYGSVGAGRPSPNRVLEAIKRFVAGGFSQVRGARIRHLCWGLAHAPGNTGVRPLIEQPEKFRQLIAGLDELIAKGKLRLPAWRGLLVCYLTTNVEDAHARRDSWLALRRFLQTSLEPICEAQRHRRMPEWLAALRTNHAVLSDRPYAPYVEQWLSGDRSTTDRLKNELEIPEYSWFWDWLVAAVVVEACKKPERQFRSLIPDLLKLIDKRAERVRDKALARILTQYHEGERSLNRGLLEYVIDRKVWGSPRVRTPRWGLVEPAVQKMVIVWMTEQDLRDFFTLLGDHRETDQARLEFWLQYIDEIQDSHIIMGSDARTGRAFRELRERRKDSLRYLSDGQGGNNAFVMKMGDHVVVEFGMTGNACYIYQEAHLPFTLGENRWFTVKSLKDRDAPGATKQGHHADWQWKLQQKLKRRGIRPSQPR